jgi:hypothetical protein
MTTIYLMHPKHGVKVATMEAEAQYDEMNGWRRFELEDIQDDAVDALEPDAILPEAEVEANVMAETPRRRGRPRADKGD